MGPVFLFHMSIIVFVIGSASGELDGKFSVSEVSEEMIVEELAAVVAIEAEDREREVRFEGMDLFYDTGLALSPYCSLFCPGSGDVDEVKSIGVHSLRGSAAMGDQIGFEESWA